MCNKLLASASTMQAHAIAFVASADSLLRHERMKIICRATNLQTSGSSGRAAADSRLDRSPTLSLQLNATCFGQSRGAIRKRRDVWWRGGVTCQRRAASG